MLLLASYMQSLPSYLDDGALLGPNGNQNSSLMVMEIDYRSSVDTKSDIHSYNSDNERSKYRF